MQIVLESPTVYLHELLKVSTCTDYRNVCLRYYNLYLLCCAKSTMGKQCKSYSEDSHWRIFYQRHLMGLNYREFSQNFGRFLSHLRFTSLMLCSKWLEILCTHQSCES